MSEVTRILAAIEQGDLQAAAQLFPLVIHRITRLPCRSRLSPVPPAPAPLRTEVAGRAGVLLGPARLCLRIQFGQVGGHRFQGRRLP
jgi:hypothetical protein